MAKQVKYGFILHPEEWKMVREVLPPTKIADGLFPVLDACLLADDPSEAIGSIIKTDLCARIFWDRNVRDITKYAENLEQAAERQRRFREARANAKERAVTESNGASRAVTPSNASNGHNTNTNTDTNTDTNTKNNNRSVTVPLPPATTQTERNVNGTGEILVKGGIEEAKRLARKAAKALNGEEGDQAFFNAEHDAVSLILALTTDYGSINRWRQLVRTKGEAAVCEELFTFWREIRAGEDCDNRAAAINKRLANLPDEKKETK